MTDPSTPVPSDEPSAAALVAAVDWIPAFDSDAEDIRGGLKAAYRIDAPAIHAAGVAEGRAATLREVEAWLGAREVGTARIADFHRTLNPEANPDDT